jgi:uncharacterized protein
MPDLTTPLNDEELARLDDALLNRFDEGDYEIDGDEGILDVTELDGFLTAIVSVPVMIMPSQWWPMIWGDYPSVFESEKDLEQVFSWAMRHMNGISAMLMQQPVDFEPMFSECEVEGRRYTIVDEWCEGYMSGVKTPSHPGKPRSGVTHRELVGMTLAPAVVARNSRSAVCIETYRERNALCPLLIYVHVTWTELLNIKIC